VSRRFDGKVAFVTGASSGIGRATALAFAREASSVVVADVAADRNAETAGMIEQAGGRTLAVTCDVTRAADIKAALNAAVEPKRTGKRTSEPTGSCKRLPRRAEKAHMTADNRAITTARLGAWLISHARVFRFRRPARPGQVPG
jgi:NAD(P)-dependent dehydrogenase (short-subunit alcohol dehydrogenase family)